MNIFRSIFLQLSFNFQIWIKIEQKLKPLLYELFEILDALNSHTVEYHLWITSICSWIVTKCVKRAVHFNADIVWILLQCVILSGVLICSWTSHGYTIKHEGTLTHWRQDLCLSWPLEAFYSRVCEESTHTIPAPRWSSSLPSSCSRSPSSCSPWCPPPTPPTQQQQHRTLVL